MDWAKAKVYLIAALIMVNGILLYSLDIELRDVKTQNYYTPAGIHDLNTHLYRYGITVDTELVNKKIPTKTLLVEYKSITSESYPELFMDYGDRLDILGDKHMVLRLPNVGGIQNQDDALIYAIGFLEKYFPEENFAIKNIEENQSQIMLTLNPLIEDKILEDARTIFTFGKFSGVEIEKIQMEIIEEKEKPNRQMSSVEAIIEAAPHLPYGSVIKSVDLIYYYSSSVNQTIFNTKTATAMPTWRIRTADGYFEYIMAIE